MKNILYLITATLLSLISTITIAQNQHATIQVNVTNFKNVNLKGEQILFVNQTTKKITKGISNSKGDFIIKLTAGLYLIKMKSISDVKDYSSIEIPKLSEGQTYTDMAMQIQMSVPKYFTLNNIHFASNQSVLLRSSSSQLKDLVEYLKLKPNLRIEIQGHTDSDGSETANMELSIKRANAIKKYLVTNGITATRLKTVGYGEGRPVAENSTAQGKQKNRRTEVRVL
jgi:outer membrane protein OmpA-like peptidoglycan-associated protein